MENFSVSRFFDRFISWGNGLAQEILKDLPPEKTLLVLGAALCMALLAAMVVFLFARRKKTVRPAAPQSTRDFSEFFQQAGTVMDVARTEALESVLGRAVVTRVKDEGVTLEVIEDTGISRLNSGDGLTMMFPPERVGGSRVNSFAANITLLDCGDDGCGRLTVSKPSGFALVRRRQHKRKRVVDQQFIRIKIWRGAPLGDDTSFVDAAPDLAVNSYDPRSSGHESNQVINISNGGIAVSVHQDLVDNKISINDDVLINIFMFNFRQKVFKPYWYAGRVRSVEEFDGTNYRMGVQFTMHGRIRDENEQYIDWSAV